MMNTHRLSKSRYLSGAQCALRLWYDTFDPALAGAPDEVAKAAFDTGREVGEAARRRYPGGHRVGHDHRHLGQALEETRRLVASGAAPALFEAAFEHRGVLVRADVLERLPEGGWRLLEIKSSTRMKDPFLLDAALQLWVLRGAGLDVRDAAVLTLNRDYVFDGAHLDLEALFTAHPVFDEANALRDDIGAQVRALRAMLARPAAPDIAPGAHCLTPHACPYHATCTRDSVVPEHGIDELPRLAARRRVALQAARVEDIRDVPADFPLTAPQRIVARAVREGRALVHGDLPGALSRLAPPVRHLDFETFAPAPSRASRAPAPVTRFPSCSPCTPSETAHRPRRSTTCTSATTIRAPRWPSASSPHSGAREPSARTRATSARCCARSQPRYPVGPRRCAPSRRGSSTSSRWCETATTTRRSGARSR